MVMLAKIRLKTPFRKHVAQLLLGILGFDARLFKCLGVHPFYLECVFLVSHDDPGDALEFLVQRALSFEHLVVVSALLVLDHVV